MTVMVRFSQNQTNRFLILQRVLFSDLISRSRLWVYGIFAGIGVTTLSVVIWFVSSNPIFVAPDSVNETLTPYSDQLAAHIMKTEGPYPRITIALPQAGKALPTVGYVMRPNALSSDPVFLSPPSTALTSKKTAEVQDSAHIGNWVILKQAKRVDLLPDAPQQAPPSRSKKIKPPRTRNIVSINRPTASSPVTTTSISQPETAAKIRTKQTSGIKTIELASLSRVEPNYKPVPEEEIIVPSHNKSEFYIIEKNKKFQGIWLHVPRVNDAWRPSTSCTYFIEQARRLRRFLDQLKPICAVKQVRRISALQATRLGRNPDGTIRGR